MNIQETSFSKLGSYISIIADDQDLYLRSLHGKSKSNMNSLKLIPLYNNEAVPFTIDADYHEIVLTYKNEKMRITFATDEKILIKSDSPSISLQIDTLPKFNYEYNYFFDVKPIPYCVVNSYKNLTKYLVYAQNGTISLNQSIQINEMGGTNTSDNQSVIDCIPTDGSLEIIIEDIPTNMLIPSEHSYDYDECVKRNKDELEEYTNRFNVNITDRFKEACYVIWSNTVKPLDTLRHHGIYSSNRNFPGVWSWDNFFVSLALNGVHDDYAFDFIECIFEHQDTIGQIPGSVSDSSIRWNFSKPPVIGHFILKMMETHTFRKDQLEKIYEWVLDLVNFYLLYKDCNRDGICEYHHGNDSGQDNSTVFSELNIVDSPDLTAYMIRNFECLSEVSKLINLPLQVTYFRERAEEYTQLFLQYFIRNNLPTARKTLSGEYIESASLLPLVSLILKDSLPENVRSAIIERIRKHHITQWGISTEAYDSPKYSSDAYWRGPIWGPSSILMIDALEDCDEKDLADELRNKYIMLVDRSGFNENFDALTGEGLRDTAFSWTAAAYIYFTNRQR